MKVAKFRAAAFVSSCDFEILSFNMSSSRTLIDLAFSFAAAMVSTEGMLVGKRKETITEIWCGYYIAKLFRAIMGTLLSIVTGVPDSGSGRFCASLTPYVQNSIRK